MGDSLPLVEAYLAVGGVEVEAVGAEGVVPQVDHVLPAAHHAVVHGVGDVQHVATFTGLVAHHQVLGSGVRGQWRVFFWGEGSSRKATLSFSPPNPLSPNIRS